MNATEAARWLAYSLSDLQAAKKLLDDPDSYPRQVCFLAQQSAEKAFKAILVFLELEFPYTHDLDRLREAIPAGWNVKREFPQLYGLSIWSVESRYPGGMPDVVTADAESALLMAEAIYRTIDEDFQANLQTGNPLMPID
jgi:HEPN domain-containing protein